MAVYNIENKLWRSPNRPFSDEKTSPGQQFLDIISAHGSKVAQINDETGVQMTYHDIWTESVRIAQNLLKQGIEPRDVIGFIADYSEHLVPLMVASICLACPMAPLYVLQSEEDIVRFFRKIKPTAVFCEVSACDQLKKALEELSFSIKVFTLSGQVDGFESVESLLVETGEEDHFVPTIVDPESDIGVITCSSGTTGPSKCLSIQYNRTLFTERNVYDSNNVVYCTSEIYWTIGMQQVFDCIHSGATHVRTTVFTPETPLKMIDEYKVTILSIATHDLIACLKMDLIQTVDLSSVQELIFYGAHMPDDLINQVNQYFSNAKIVELYGMTELGVISSSIIKDFNYDGGNFADGFTIKIVDEDGKRCGPNVMGELRLKKEHTFSCYLDDPVATANALDNEGFFRTGDIVYIDDNGRLFVKDRIKNVLSLFYFDDLLLPFEIEECLIKMPSVKEVCVVGVPIVGSATLPAALIVRKSNCNLSQYDVFDKIADHFPNQSKLRAGVYFVESFPKTSNGKLVRHKITKIAIEMFENAKQNDSDVQSYLLDIPSEYRKLI